MSSKPTPDDVGAAAGPERLNVDDEISYSVFQESFDLMLHLVDESLTSIELAMRLGEDPKEIERQLSRLARRDIVVRDDSGRYRAAGRHVYQQRQEGLMDFLARYVLPVVARGLAAGAQDDAWLASESLELLPKQVGVLRGGALQKVVDELLALSDRAEEGPRRRCTVVLAGSPGSDAGVKSDEQLGDAGRYLNRVKRAAMLRARSETREQSVLLQIDMRLGSETRAAVRDALRRAAEGMRQQFGVADAHPFELTFLYVSFE